MSRNLLCGAVMAAAIVAMTAPGAMGQGSSSGGGAAGGAGGTAGTSTGTANSPAGQSSGGLSPTPGTAGSATRGAVPGTIVGSGGTGSTVLPGTPGTNPSAVPNTSTPLGGGGRRAGAAGNARVGCDTVSGDPNTGSIYTRDSTGLGPAPRIMAEEPGSRELSTPSSRPSGSVAGSDC